MVIRHFDWYVSIVSKNIENLIIRNDDIND